MKHPIQNTTLDDHGTLRFVGNAVVELMLTQLKERGIGLNELHVLGAGLPREDWDQFIQLISYSVHGAPISQRCKNIAIDRYQSGKTALELRAERAERQLRQAREELREGIADLYDIHPDDLVVDEITHRPKGT